jgi:hypothetical protein
MVSQTGEWFGWLWQVGMKQVRGCSFRMKMAMNKNEMKDFFMVSLFSVPV